MGGSAVLGWLFFSLAGGAASSGRRIGSIGRGSSTSTMEPTIEIPAYPASAGSTGVQNYQPGTVQQIHRGPFSTGVGPVQIQLTWTQQGLCKSRKVRGHGTRSPLRGEPQLVQGSTTRRGPPAPSPRRRTGSPQHLRPGGVPPTSGQAQFSTWCRGEQLGGVSRAPAALGLAPGPPIRQPKLRHPRKQPLPGQHQGPLESGGRYPGSSCSWDGTQVGAAPCLQAEGL